MFQTLQRALYLDSFSNSHPIQVTVSDPSQINEIFDKISYDKVGQKTACNTASCVCMFVCVDVGLLHHTHV